MKAGIAVKEFEVRYSPDADGKLKETHFVHYGPIGSLDRTCMVERIDRLSRVQGDSGGEDNIAILAAKARWDVIGPAYENWRMGREAIETGTPLAAWNRLSRAQADRLILHGVRTVESIAELTDTHIDRFGLPGLRDIIIDAKRFLAAQESNAVQAEMKAKDEKINNLTAIVEQMQAQMAELAKPKRGPGRPPRSAAEDAEEAEAA